MLKPQFHVEKFEEMIQRRGRTFLWEQARQCPRWDLRTHSPLDPCPLCRGLGWLYTPKGLYKATILGITGSKQWARFGDWLQGDAVMTFPSRLSIGDKDRITLTTGEYRESAVLVKGSNDVLPEMTVFDVLECGDANRLYTFGRDFVLDDARIVWRGSQPPEGATYSVLYRALPVYLVWQTLPQVRAQVPSGPGGSLREMPRKVMLRRWVDFVRPGVG